MPRMGCGYFTLKRLEEKLNIPESLVLKHCKKCGVGIVLGKNGKKLVTKDWMKVKHSILLEAYAISKREVEKQMG